MSKCPNNIGAARTKCPKRISVQLKPCLVSWYMKTSRSLGDFFKSILFSRVSDLYKFGHIQLDKSIFVLRLVGRCFSILSKFQLNILQAKCEDPGQTPHSACLCPTKSMLGLYGLVHGIIPLPDGPSYYTINYGCPVIEYKPWITLHLNNKGSDHSLCECMLISTFIYPTKKETHHLELFNSQEDHKE